MAMSCWPCLSAAIAAESKSFCSAKREIGIGKLGFGSFRRASAGAAAGIFAALTWCMDGRMKGGTVRLLCALVASAASAAAACVLAQGALQDSPG